MAEKVVLMDRGNSLSTGISKDTNTATAIFWSLSARPELTGQDLPELGSSWVDPICGTMIDLILTNVNRVPIAEDHTLGYEYVCSYVPPTRITYDPFEDANTTTAPNIPSIQTSAEFDSWQYGGTASTQTSGASGAMTLYFCPSGSSVVKLVDPMSIHKTTCLTNLSVTTRVKTSFQGIVEDGLAYTGKINSNTWNGVNVGNVLCTGMVATPLTEVVSGAKQISYNRTLGFSIKTVPGDDQNNWQKIFYNGQYGLLYSKPDKTGEILLYEYADLPSNLS